MDVSKKIRAARRLDDRSEQIHDEIWRTNPDEKEKMAKLWKKSIRILLAESAIERNIAKQLRINDYETLIEKQSTRTKKGKQQ